jgi:hypothetical protein
MSNFCEQCGSPLGTGVRFCEQCGQPVAKIVEHIRDISPQSSTPAPKGISGSSGKKKVLIGSGIVLGLAMLAVGSLLFWRSQQLLPEIHWKEPTKEKSGAAQTQPFTGPGSSQIVPPASQPNTKLMNQFNVGRQWLIDWQSLFHYKGVMQIQRQLKPNLYLTRITISYLVKNKKITVSMDGLLTIQGKKVVINCSNPSESWWDTDDFYLEWNEDTMTGFNIDKKGRRGTARFNFVGDASLGKAQEVTGIANLYVPQKASSSSSIYELNTPSDVVKQYMNYLDRGDIDGAYNLLS